MTKAAALQTFFASFGLSAYERYSVPHDAEYPYITYDYATGIWGAEFSITLDIWYRGKDNTAPNEKAEELSARLGLGGTMLPCDGGALWIKRGSPFCQSLSDPGDDMIKRRHINLSAETLTA